jgi:hypothetical protein
MAVEADEKSSEAFKQFVEQAKGLTDLDLMNVVTALAAIFMDRKKAQMLKLGVDQDGLPITVCMAYGPAAAVLANGYAALKDLYVDIGKKP